MGHPVLVVCYTNHALDQFLEAVVMVMKSMNLNPSSHLVRVGFQTKSEEMKKLLLDKQLEEANRLGDSGRLPKSFRDNFWHARGKLHGRKHYRSHLVGSLRVLNECDGGILNLKSYFELLTDGRRHPDLTEAEFNFLLTLAKLEGRRLEALFGLGTYDFYNPNFNCFNWMRKTFGASFATTRREEPQAAKQRRQPLEGDAEEGKLDEDFDMEELMANRLQELEFELDTDVKKAEVVEPCYLINAHANPETVSNPYIDDIQKLICQKETKIPKNCEKEPMDLVQARIWKADEIFMLGQTFKTIREVMRAYHEKCLTLSQVTLQESAIPTPRESWAIYFQLLEKCKTVLMKGIVEMEDELQQLDEAFKEAQNSCYGQILKQAMFVGMTTTGAAKYNSLLPVMQSRLVIVEEAAEVLESHVMTCITRYCEHFILIGDHKQLRPKTAVYNLARQYHLDVSLFERMINNNLNLYLLEVQHRMRPEICELIVPTIYEKLMNHESVFKYPSVLGLETSMFFISHKEPEIQEEDSTSKSNQHEANFLVRLCRHLILQGYSTARITILTTYIGQMFLIKNIMREYPTLFQGLRVTVVDNFQGEENDIILLSLVRSNDQNKIGFLNTDNRICVALSRAKHGFYVIGNMTSMAASSPTWTMIMANLSQNHKVGAELILKCEAHGELMEARVATDFDKAPEGGCSRMCEGRLPKCAHICRLVCHVVDKDHKEYECQYPCNQKCKKYSHPCRQACYEACTRCTVRVDTLLSCGHSRMLECYVDALSYLCPVEVLKTLPCNHHLEIKCSEDPTIVECREHVVKSLPCGHFQDAPCYVKEEKIPCLTKIRVLIRACQHPLEIMCYEKDDPSTWVCEMKCDTRVPCGHACVMKCHVLKDPNHEKYTCPKECGRTCPLGHPCSPEFEHKHKCHSKCPNCMIPVHTELKCSHSAIIPCFQSLNPAHVVLCEVPTRKKSIDCPHEISVPCYQTPAKALCTELVLSTNKMSPCGHAVEVPCNMEEKVEADELLRYCQMPCGQQLFDPEDKIGCGHKCEGLCSECFRGRLHRKCGKKCGRVLACGHMCKSTCSAVCPPCTENCDFRCVHSKCKAKCGKPCPSCKESCDASCPHSKCTKRCGEPCDWIPCDVPCTIELQCGHPCVGLCSERCPKLCRICDVDELTEIFLGNEGEPDARYIELEDCRHIFEVNDLDNWILKTGSGSTSENVDVKRCPRCKTIIRTSHRYKNALKGAYAGVIKWKERIFGQTQRIKPELLKIASRLEDEKFRETPSLFFFVDFMSRRIYRAGWNPIQIPRNEFPRNGYYRDRVTKNMDQFQLETLSNMLLWCEEGVMNLREFLSSTQESTFSQRFNRFQRLAFIHQRHQLEAKNEGAKGMLSKSYRLDLEKKYVELFSELTRRAVPLSRMELKQFSNEFQRLSDLFQLYRRYSVDQFQQFNVQLKCGVIKTFLLKSPSWNKATRQKFGELLKEVDATMKFSLPEVKRRTLQAIFSALDSAGSWYTCPNGHLYLIGDCGNPNASSTCPDCRAAIGGDNTHAAAAAPGNVRASAHRQLPPPTAIFPTPDFLE